MKTLHLAQNNDQVNLSIKLKNQWVSGFKFFQRKYEKLIRFEECLCPGGSACTVKEYTRNTSGTKNAVLSYI